MAIERDGSVPVDNLNKTHTKQKKRGKKEIKDTTKPKSPQEGPCDMSCNEYSAYVSILSNLIKGVSCFMSIELSKNHSSF